MGRYHVNFRANEGRRSSFQDSATIYAAGDGQATAIAAILDGITTGQQVSLSKNIQLEAPDDYLEGTVETCTAISADENESLWKFRLRNIKDDTEKSDVAALLLGIAGTGTNPVTALSAPPSIPASGLPIVVVRNISFVDKS